MFDPVDSVSKSYSDKTSRWIGLLVSATASVLWASLPVAPVAPIVTLLLVVAFGGLAYVVVAEMAHPVLDKRAVLVVAMIALVVVSVMPSRRSHDVWAYAAYGELVVGHHVSPNTHRPSEFPRDIAVERMAPGWRHSRSVYGPVFTAISVAAVFVTGDSWATRLIFQFGAALCIGACLVLLSRRCGCIPLIMVGLNPLVIVSVVNGGHNDALVALLLLIACVAAAERRDHLAGGLAGVAVNVKVIALLPAVALAYWAWRRTGSRVIPLWIAGISVVGYSLVGGVQAVLPILAAGSLQSRSSVWMPVHVFLHSMHLSDAHVGLAAAGSVVALTALLVWAYADDAMPYRVVALPLVAYMLLAGYVLPWYLVSALPLLAMKNDKRIILISVGLTGLYMLAYQYSPGRHTELNSLLLISVTTLQLVKVAAAVFMAQIAVRHVRREPALQVSA